MFIRRLFALISIFLFLFLITPVSAYADNQVNVYFFWGDGCPHCAKEKPFLEQLEKKYDTLKVHKYEVWYDASNRELLKKAGEYLKTDVNGVPFTVVGDKHIVGYQDNQTTGKEIEKIIESCLEKKCVDPLSTLISATSSTVNEKTQMPSQTVPQKISIPFFGDIQTKDVSLPALTIIMGALDGFNPCAMWTLLFLISLLIGMHDRRRMWILGSTFIIASAAVYFLFMAAWLHLILFIGFIFWFRLIIGLLGIGGGLYNLKEYWTNKESACKVTRNTERRKVFDALKEITQEKNFIIAFVGIILLAAVVNVIELVCSAGFPVIYTQTLALNNLPVWQYYLYLLFYIIIFMFDDLLVFIISMKTLEVTGITTKYSRFSHLIGGILMLILGVLLIFKPELLMFG